MFLSVRLRSACSFFAFQEVVYYTTKRRCIADAATTLPRHAHGDALYLNVTENDTEVTVVFTNNGEQPDGPVHESGGLATLHALACRAGGTMEIRTSPRFSLTLTLPKEVPYAI